MKTLKNRYDLWHAYNALRELWSSETVLDRLAFYLGDDEVRRFVDTFIRERDAEDHFRDYEEFAEEEEEEEEEEEY